MAGMALAALAAGAAADVPCDNGLVTVQSDAWDLAGQVCAAADHAFAIFAECGAGLSGPVSIRIQEEILGGCLGLFHCGQGIIEVLTPETISQAADAAGLYAHMPPDAMFESIVIHESTHALYDGTPCAAEFTKCLVTSEYLAYALQFEALPDDARAPWLDRFDPDKPVKRDVISLGMLMLKNDEFALSAWAHLNQRADRCAWIGGILDGSIVFDHPRP